MRISKLGLVDFEVHTNSLIELDRVNIIIGPNGSGKTSIINSLGLAISGVLPTKPYTDYIRLGTSQAIVNMEAVVGDKTRNTRKVVKTDGKIVTELMSTNALLASIGTNTDTARTLIDTLYFVESADDKLRRSILSSVLTPKMSLEDLITVVSSHAIADDISFHAQLITDNFDNLDSQKKTQIEILYKIVYDMRRDRKKDLDRLTSEISMIDTKLSTFTTNTDIIDDEAIKRTIKHSELASNIVYEEKNLQTICNEISNYSKKLDGIKNSITELKPHATAKITKEEVDALLTKISVLESQVRGQRATLQKLSEIGSTDSLRCPYFEQCKYPDAISDINEAITNVNATIEKTTTELESVKKTYDTENDMLSTLTKITEMEAIINMANKKIEEMQATHKLQLEKVENLRTEIAELEKAGIIDSNKVDASKHVQEVEVLKARKLTYASDLELVKNNMPVLERAVSLYNNQELWASTLSHNRDVFITKLKETIAMLIPKYTPQVSDDMILTFSGVSVNTLSKSEKFKVGVAIQTALAISSKIGVLVTDGSDIITDPSEFLELINKLSTVPEIETIIVASSVDLTKLNTRKKIECPASMFTVNNGVVTKHGSAHDTAWG